MYKLIILIVIVVVSIMFMIQNSLSNHIKQRYTRTSDDKELTKKTSDKRVRWRDECTSKELTSVLIIPNRYSKYEDLPEHTSTQYLPDVDKLINKPENKINELTMLIEPPPKELLVNKPRLMLQ